jgi:hypothetical protein
MWTASLAAPITASKNLLPTFLNQLSARQYDLVVRLSIKGFHHGRVELVLPVQVIFHPPQGMSGLSQEESRVENQDPASLTISSPSHHFIDEDFDRQTRFLQAQDSSPPSYD